MSKYDEPGIPEDPPSNSGHIRTDHIGPLMRLAGPREAIPADRMRRVKSAVRAEWRQQVRARSRRIVIGWSVGAFAAAALVLLGVRVAVRDDPAASPRYELATIEVLSGAVRPMSSSGRGELRLFQVGDGIREGDGVDTTSGGQAALRLASGASVRMDRGTRLKLVSDAVMILDEGAIYVDSGDRAGVRSFEVRTKLGVVRDIGTRFEVRLDTSALRVRVRDGLVRLTQSRQSHDAQPGDELTLDGSGSLRRRTMPVHGAEWAWTMPLVHPFDLEGRSLRDFLEWVTKENGWQLRFVNAAVEKMSLTAMLHGSIHGLTPDEALSAVLPASGVGYRLDDGILHVRLGAGTSKD